MSYVAAPPPSPIPTGRGSRSAANETLTEFLDKSPKVPDLTLPEPHQLANVRQETPREINYRLLMLRDYASVDRLLRSSRELGVFRISYHGIAGEQLRSFVKDADRVFTVSEQTDTGFRKISWVRPSNETMQLQSPRKCLDADGYHDFSEKTENVVSQLEAIKELLCKILVENIRKRLPKNKMEDKQPMISLCKYNHNNNKELNTHFPDEKDGDLALCFYFSTRRSKFLVQSEKGCFCFDTGPDTIVVSIGKLLEEWSTKDFRCVSCQIIPYLQNNQAAFSIKLKYWSLSGEVNSNKGDSTISIGDQILTALVIVFLYDVYVFLHS